MPDKSAETLQITPELPRITPELPRITPESAETLINRRAEHRGRGRNDREAPLRGEYCPPGRILNPRTPARGHRSLR